MRLIDADVVIRIMEKMKADARVECNNTKHIICQMVIEIIEAQPTVEIE